VSERGSVSSPPTCSAGTVSTPSARGCRATAYSTRARTSPSTTSTRRVLVWPLVSKSAPSGAQSGAAVAWSVSMFRVAVSPSWMRSRSSHARVAAPAGWAAASSSASSSHAAMGRAGRRFMDMASVCPLPVAPLVLEAEPRPQQSAGIVRDPAQPGVGCLPALTLLDGRGANGREVRFFLPRIFQRALHLFAQGLVSVVLGVGIRGAGGRIAGIGAVGSGLIPIPVVRGHVPVGGIRRRIIATAAIAITARGFRASGVAIAVAVIAWLGLAIAWLGGRPLQRLFHGCAVGQGVLHPRLQFQRAVVGGPRLLQTPRAGERIAPVVRGVGARQLLPQPRRAFEVTAAVGFHRRQRALVGQLVGTLPQPTASCMGRLRKQRQAQP